MRSIFLLFFLIPFFSFAKTVDPSSPEYTLELVMWNIFAKYDELKHNLDNMNPNSNEYYLGIAKMEAYSECISMLAPLLNNQNQQSK